MALKYLQGHFVPSSGCKFSSPPWLLFFKDCERPEEKNVILQDLTSLLLQFLNS